MPINLLGRSVAEKPNSKLTLQRVRDTGNETYGVFYRVDDALCVSVELPWRENKPNISCILPGTYPIQKSTMKNKHGVTVPCIRLQGVPGHTGICLHSANKAIELEGCIAPGLEFQDYGVYPSSPALERLMNLAPFPKEIEVKGSPDTDYTLRSYNRVPH